MSRYLDPKADIVFRRIFGEHPHLLKSFLNAILPLPEDGLIESLEYLLPEQTPRIPILKNNIVDVKCYDQQGRIFIVEMQMEWTDGFMQRLLFGASQAYVRQLEKGEDYNLLHPVYGLGLLNSIFDKTSADWYHHYKIVNIAKPERELKGLQFLFIEIPKFKPTTLREKKLQILWLRFLSEIDEKTQQIPEELLAVPEIQEAMNLSEEASYTPAELAAYDQYWDAVSTERTLISGKYEEGRMKGRTEGRTEGRAEGHAEGRHERTLEIARDALRMNLSLEQIAKLTRLTTDELKKLLQD